MKIKRLIAFIIDLVLVGLLITIVLSFLPIDITEETSKINQLNQMVIEKIIDFKEYINTYKILVYNYDLGRIFVTILNLIATIILYIVIPLKWNGQTIGMKLMKIKIVREDNEVLTFKDLFIRSTIINCLGYIILSIIFILIFNKNIYFYASSILILLTFLLVFISGFMILYRQDQKGLQDFITKTKVIRN